jgi:hypothetical protein
VLAGERDGARLVEAPGDDQHRVVGLVPGAVERLQLVDRHALDVRALADDGVAVVVPRERKLLHALEQHPAGVVLAELELVAHHGHLGFEVVLRHERVHHAVGLHGDRPGEVGVGGGQGLEIVRAVVGGRAVEARTAARELLLQARVALRALEKEMLEEVGHAFLAVAFVARAHQVHDVHGDGVHAGVGQREELQPVRQSPLGDALDGLGFCRLRRGRGRCGKQRHQKEKSA